MTFIASTVLCVLHVKPNVISFIPLFTPPGFGNVSPNIPYTWPPSYTFIRPVKIHSKYRKSTCFQSNAAEICKRLE